MAIELTPAAADEVRRVLQEQGLAGPEVCLRVGLQPRSADQAFTLDLAQRPEPGDEGSVCHGIHVACTAENLLRLDGYTIDFRTLSGGRGFTFTPPAKPPSRTPRNETSERSASPDFPQVHAALREVIDPEVGINIVDLGLVYGLDIRDRNIHVTMTMTTPACPLSEQIKNDVYARIMDHCPGVTAVDVQLVWDPPWRSDLISKDAKRSLGWSR